MVKDALALSVSFSAAKYRGYVPVTLTLASLVSAVAQCL